jgi:hypothetical protein
MLLRINFIFEYPSVSIAKMLTFENNLPTKILTAKKL